MSVVPALDQMVYALRTTVCTRCEFRAVDSDLLPSDEPRSCEPQCAIFLNLPRLKHLAEDLDPLAGSFDHAVKSLVCLECRAQPVTSHCNSRINRRCPLSKYHQQVAEVLEGIK